jgi:hypothetical protein
MGTEDRATVVLMNRLMELLAGNGMSPAAALRKPTEHVARQKMEPTKILGSVYFTRRK